MDSNLVGILVCHIDSSGIPGESRLYRQMSICADARQVRICVFTLHSVRWEERRIEALQYDANADAWHKRILPLPSIVYDRRFFRSALERRRHASRIIRLKRMGVLFLNTTIGDKWDVYVELMKDADLQSLLPVTWTYTGPKSLIRWFEHHDEVFLKPQHGSKGMRTLRIVRDALGRFHLNGRDAYNRSYTAVLRNLPMVSRFVERAVRRQRFLMQPYLQLTTSLGQAFDVRALMQKDGDGRWSLTGTAVRQGQPGSATSNLHGGGDAFETESFLRREFGEQRMHALCKALHRAARRIAPLIEQRYGRLCELGIDFGIDRSGKLWLLEVNSKPGKTIFAKSGQFTAKTQSICNPLRYAEYLWTGRGLLAKPYRRVTG